MIYVIDKMLLSLKNHLKYVKDFLKEYDILLLFFLFFKKKSFSQHNNGKFKSWRIKHN